ncbi:glycosyltransferase family 2 protein [Actinoplanes sp. NPDC023801]|uniref:glycosyltransferase family 2 protein n=1 Tax=Actinoplanes sp. NPDC023801 TaxID=3154595 RepID=UPI0033E07FB6
MPTVDRVLPGETDAVIDIPAIPAVPAIPDLPDDPDDGAEPEPRISVIVPALNEAQNLPHVFARLPQVDEIVLVDGGSTDDTVAVARRLRPDIRVVRQNRKGKGNALACGFAEATGDIIVMIDADGSTDPMEIPRFVEALREGADFAKGSRFRPNGGSADITRLRRAGNKCLSMLVNVMFRTRYSDLCYGYNAFWAHCLDVFDLDSTSPAPDNADGRLWGDGFEIETLLNLRAARADLKITEVASFEHNRIHGVSNLNALTDGVRVLRTIAREWRPRQAGGRRVAERQAR